MAVRDCCGSVFTARHIPADVLVKNAYPLVVIGVDNSAAVALGLVFHIGAGLVVDAVMRGCIGDGNHHSVLVAHHDCSFNRVGGRFRNAPAGISAGFDDGIVHLFFRNPFIPVPSIIGV